MACWLERQFRRRGPTWDNMELWGEVCIGHAKAAIKYRTHSGPEVGLVNRELMSTAFHCTASRHGLAPQLTARHWRHKPDSQPAHGGGANHPASACPAHDAAAVPSPAWRGQVRLAAEVDQSLQQLPSHVLGKGRRVPRGERDELVQAMGASRLLRALNLNQSAGEFDWERADLTNEEVEFCEYNEAWVSHCHAHVTSDVYTRHRTRDGAAVILAFQTSGGTTDFFAARVSRFLCIRRPPPINSTTLLAVCNLYRSKDVTDTDLGDLALEVRLVSGAPRGDELRDKRNFTCSGAFSDYPVLLDSIQYPAVQHQWVEEQASGAIVHKVMFLPYCLRSGRAQQRARQRLEHV